MDRSELSIAIKSEATRLGFDMVGIAPAVAPPGHERFVKWLAQGFAAGMSYLERSADARAEPQKVFAGARSIVMVGMLYGGGEGAGSETALGPTEGKIARYARGMDYHEVLWRRLERLLEHIQTLAPEIQGRATADTAPLLERDFAALSGLGWIGKNTMLINRRLGSYTVLGALLLNVELDYDSPLEGGHCGTCTKCLDLCPTDAFNGPYRLDSRKCLSYWTIEHKGPMSDEYSDKLGDWVFGCDVCQEVCPWNRKAPRASDPALSARPDLQRVDLLDWLVTPPSQFSARLKHSALSRAKRRGFVRNAALILGTRRVEEARPALERLVLDEDDVVRDAARKALELMSRDRPA